MKKILTGTMIIVPGVNMVLDLLDRLEVFAQKPGREVFARMLELKAPPDALVQGINRQTVADLVAALYLDMLQETSKWAQVAGKADHTTAQWKRMVENWTEISTRKLENELFVEVIRDAYEDIHDWLNGFDSGEPSWHVWYVRRLGLDIAIEKGPDFRILDWERRMRAGADHLKAQENGDQLPPEAWLPDEDGKRFAELIQFQSTQPTMLGKSAVDELDNQQRQAKRRSLQRNRPSGRKHRGRTPL